MLKTSMDVWQHQRESLQHSGRQPEQQQLILNARMVALRTMEKTGKHVKICSKEYISKLKRETQTGNTEKDWAALKQNSEELMKKRQKQSGERTDIMFENISNPTNP